MYKKNTKRSQKLSRKSLEHRFDYLMKSVLEEFESCVTGHAGYDRVISVLDEDVTFIDKVRGP